MLNKSPGLPAQFKADIEQRLVEGYASTFGNVDSVGDVMMPGAFRKTIADRFPRKVIKSCYNHGPLIGSPVSLTEDSTGLFTVTKISNNPIGTAVLQDIADGHVTHMSFAYDVVRRDFLQPEDATKAPIRQLQEVKLYEYGPVDFPANEMASILGAKAIADALDEALGALPELERVWQQKGFLSDRQRDLHHHLTGVVVTAITSAIKALSEETPELTTLNATTVDESGAATTPSLEPPPNQPASDPEDLAYLGLSLKLAALTASLPPALRGTAGA